MIRDIFQYNTKAKVAFGHIIAHYPTPNACLCYTQLHTYQFLFHSFKSMPYFSLEPAMFKDEYSCYLTN